VPILNIVFTHMRQQQMVEIKGMVRQRLSLYALAGRQNAGAAERFQITQYAGAAPVSLKEYQECHQSAVRAGED